MKLTLLDYDPRTHATTEPYGSITLNADGSLTSDAKDIPSLIRVKTCLTNALNGTIRSGIKTPTNAQVLTWLSTKSPKAANERIVVEN